MQITEKRISVRELSRNYNDNGDNGVFAYDNRLVVRPAFQREFVYNEQQREMVIDSIIHGYPLNLFYWSLSADGTFELLDGQQRTVSICEFIESKFAVNINGNKTFFCNMSDDRKNVILDYEILVEVCAGTEDEKLDWFKRINIAGVVLTEQELLNATFTGPWLADAKQHFSKRNCPAGKLGEKYIHGNPIRQDYLQMALRWVSDRDGLESGQFYMAQHQHDADAADLWQYFQTVINWAKTLFPTDRKGVTDMQEWGLLYNKYSANTYNANSLEQDLRKFILDDDVTKKSGIIPYILSNRAKADERSLSLRTFSEAQKIRVYEAQKHRCPLCQANGDDTEYPIEEMQGDHKIPWSAGGRTVDENLQLLCRKCNSEKSNH